MATSQKTSGMAIAAFVCAFLCMPIGLILGIIALVQLSGKDNQMGGKGLAIAAVVISGLSVPMTGILAAIAIPNFVRYQLRSKSMEARVNISQLVVGQQSMYDQLGRYIATAPSSGTVGKDKIAFTAAPCAAACGPEAVDACTSLACLGFEPMGPVYYRYACNTTPDGQHFTCAALGDLDGDGQYGLFVHGTGATRVEAPVPDFGGLAPPCGAVPANETVECEPGVY